MFLGNCIFSASATDEVRVVVAVVVIVLIVVPFSATFPGNEVELVVCSHRLALLVV